VTTRVYQIIESNIHVTVRRNRFVTASKQSQDGTAVPSWLCLEAFIRNLHETYQCRMYSRKFL